MVQTYGGAYAALFPATASFRCRGAICKRPIPHHAIQLVDEQINMERRARLPLLEGGLLSELIYREEPTIINDLEVSPPIQPRNTSPAWARCRRSDV